MSTSSATIQVPAEEVWAVLSDGWLYPLFVLGASRMRKVDRTWPQAGSRLHHCVGCWPALLDDQTVVLEVEPERRLLLLAQAWSGGAAEVEITLRPLCGSTEVTLREDAVTRPGRRPRPMREAQLTWRHAETLRRLAFVCEGRHATRRT